MRSALETETAGSGMALMSRVGRTVLKVMAKGGAAVYLVLLIIVFAAIVPSFLSVSTIISVLEASAPLIVVASGMTICLIASEVDLSVGAIVGLSSTVAAFSLLNGVPWLLAVPIAVLVGGLAGSFNGVLTARLAPIVPLFPSFLPTLATVAIAGGIAEALLPSRQAITINSPWFKTVFGYSPGFVGHTTIIWAFVVTGVVYILATRTSFGHRIFAVGANRRAARMAGVNVLRTKFWVMTVSGLLAGFGGVLMAGYFQAGYSQLGNGMQLDAIGAAVIGGTALFGGRGTVLGTLAGALVLAVLNVGLLLAQASPAVQLIAKGAIVVAAVAIQGYVARASAARQ